MLIIILLSGCSPQFSSGTPRLNKGILDLSDWDFESKQVIQLDGQWEFYWNRLLGYKDFENQRPDLYAGVPSTWNQYTIKGKSLPGEGYATYRLHIKTSLPEGTILGLRVYAFSSAYNLYVNEKLVASNGKVAAKASEEVGEYRPQAVFFSTPAGRFDIIVQISNFNYARGGFWYSIFMGNMQSILDMHSDIMGKEAFLLGALLIIALFNIAIFFLRRELRYTLYFGLSLIFMLINLDMVGQYILPHIIPGISLQAVVFMLYSSSCWMLFFFILFVHELFPSKFSSIVLKFYLFYSIGCLLIYTLTPTVFYTRSYIITNYLEIAGGICAIIIVAIGIKNGHKEGWLNIISMVIIVTAHIYDILYWTNVIESSFGEILYAALFLFMLLQMVVQAERIRIFHEHKTAAELSFLQAQIKPHFLYNTLNTFISISRYDMDKARDLLYNFSSYLRRSFDFKELSQFVPLKNEIELARAYAEIEKARFEERIEVNFSVCDELDAKVPTLILQPVIENAVIHGILPKPDGGRIDISIVKEDRELVFCVRDNGVGMDEKKIENILKERNEKGVGLANINSRLRKLYGKGLIIRSSPIIGTEVTWYVKTG